MRPEARLESAVFQLTPTRTRCDLVITANGKTEKLAAGLLNPFLAHLKTAQEQIAKGGYSIILEPDPKVDAQWFTKGTVERFVRFVSTPEVLERVGTIESEIFQIEEAITIQGNNSLGISTVGDHQTRTTDCTEGSKSILDSDAEKAIVLYKPESLPPDSNGSATQENSKVQLLRVLETRKTVLQKEQAMAFARAAAAGYAMDNMTHLIAFAETFGASRLREACLRFMELWRGKHETGQWLEIESTEAMPSRQDFSAFNASGIMLSADSMKQTDYPDRLPAHGGELGIESNGKANNHAKGSLNSGENGDRILPLDPHMPNGPHYFQAQFQHPAYPQWHVHSGPPIYSPYPVQSMPYYQNYAAGNPYFPGPYTSTEDARRHSTRIKNRHSQDSKDSNIDLEGHGDMSDSDKEDSQEQESKKRGSRSGKKKSGMVVIRNLNYITSKRDGKSGSECESHSEAESGEKTEDSDSPKRKNKKTYSSSKKKGSQIRSLETSDAHLRRDDISNVQETDSGNWQVFQSFLLRNKEENTNMASENIFADEKEPSVRRKQYQNGADPILSDGRRFDDNQKLRVGGFDSVNGSVRLIKQAVSGEEVLVYADGRNERNGHLDEHVIELEHGRAGVHRGTYDDAMMNGHAKQFSSSSSVPFARNEYELAGKSNKDFSHNVIDDAFLVSIKAGSYDQLGAENRTAIDVDSEFPSKGIVESSSAAKNQICYEPDDLSMIPERQMERESISYDPTIDYDLQIPIIDSTNLEIQSQDDTSTCTKEGLKMPEKEKMKTSQNGMLKKKIDLPTRGKSSKSNLLTEAQKRADKLRIYKADIQKLKKEKEEEERKRLDALKAERQKRISARSGSNIILSPSSKQAAARLPGKASTTSTGSKFCDSEPDYSSPLQKSPIKTMSSIPNKIKKNIKTGRLNGEGPVAENRLSQSVSSMSDVKKQNNSLTPEAQVASVRRLSEPKTSNIHRATHESQVASVRRLSEPKVDIRRATSLKPNNDRLPQRNLNDEPQTERISAIINLDKAKSAALPELRIRLSGTDTYQASSDMVLKKENESALTSVNADKKNTNEASSISCCEDNPVIEKNVVILENEKAFNAAAQITKETVNAEDRSYNGSALDTPGLVSDYVVVRAPPSLITADEADNLNLPKVDNRINSHEVVTDHYKNESEYSSSDINGKTYQAPFARATSLEDPADLNLTCTEAPHPRVPEVSDKDVEFSSAYVSDFVHLSCGENANEKSKSKEASQRIKKFLKFGKKGNSSATNEHSIDLEDTIIDEQSMSSSNDVHVLKNLISQDTQVGGTPPKASRTFSILSSFRSKKLAT